MRVIAIDGTFASGKGTLGKRLAAHYGMAYLDTGKLYRAVARKAQLAGIDLDAAQDAVGPAAAKLAAHLDPDMLADPILKSGDVGAAASKVAAVPEVRAALIEYQRRFAARAGGAVLDGRDIGTVICPDAQVKLYVDARPDVRAQRRYNELLSYGEDTSLENVSAQLAERDHRDMNRAQAPLKPAEDAHLLDTTDLSIDAAFGAAVNLIDALLSVKAGELDS